MKAIEFIYQDTQIHFLLGNKGDVMVNATQMANLFNKRVDDFTRLESTEKFINALINNHALLRDYIITSNKKRGTYMHRKLALKFAAWLDINFEVWIIDTIEKIMFPENDKKRKEDLERKAELVLKKDEILEKLNEYEIYKDYLDIKKELTLINSKLTKQDNAVIETKLKSLFEQDFIKN